MSSLLDHLDNNYSDGDEDDHINRLFPKCKPRASTLQPFKTTKTTSSISGNNQTSSSTTNNCKNDDVSNESRNTGTTCATNNMPTSTLLSTDCNLITNSNNTNINTVNNNIGRGRNQENYRLHHQQDQIFNEDSSKYRENGQILIQNFYAKDFPNSTQKRCMNNSSSVSSANKVNYCDNTTTINNSKLNKSEGKSASNSSNSSSSRISRHQRRNHHHHHHNNNHSKIEFVPLTGKNSIYTSSSSNSSSTRHRSSGSGSKRKGSGNISYTKVMECDTLDDNFDNGIGSGGSSSGGSGAFSQSSSASLGSTGEKNNAMTMTSSASSGNAGLRDSRIEIAGGREIYSQNRIKAGRRAVRGSSSMDSMLLHHQQQHHHHNHPTQGHGGQQLQQLQQQQPTDLESNNSASSNALHQMTNLTPSSSSSFSSQSQLQAKIRRKSTTTNNTTTTMIPNSTSCTTINPLISPTSPVSSSSCNNISNSISNNIWEPHNHHHLMSSKKNFPFSSSSSSSSRGGDREEREPLPHLQHHYHHHHHQQQQQQSNSSRSGGASSSSTSNTIISRHSSNPSGGGGTLTSSTSNSYLRRSSSHSQSPFYSHQHSHSHHSQQQQQHHSGYDYSDAKKTLSLDGFDLVGNSGSGSHNINNIGRQNILPGVHSAASSSLASPSSSSSGLMMKETVFASEITSIEKPVVKDVVSVKQPFIYETPIDGGGEIVFDDIEEHWQQRRRRRRHGSDGNEKEIHRRQVVAEHDDDGDGDDDDDNDEAEEQGTFVSMGSVDKSQVNFLETLMRDNDEQANQMQKQQQQQFQHQLLLQQQHQHQHQQTVQVTSKVVTPTSMSIPTTNSSILHGSFPTLNPGYESDECASSSICSANNSKTSPNGNKRLIGSIPIAEYEGSPKRYGLRLPTQAKPNHLELVDPNSPTISHLNVNVNVSPTSTTTTTTINNTTNPNPNSTPNTNNTSTGSSRNILSTVSLSPRLQSPSSSSSSFQGGGRVPGFPQRVDTSISNVLPTLSNNNSIKSASGASGSSSGGGGILLLGNENASVCNNSGGNSSSSNSSETVTATNSISLMERNDYKSEPGGQLNTKLDGIMPTTTNVTATTPTNISSCATSSSTTIIPSSIENLTTNSSSTSPTTTTSTMATIETAIGGGGGGTTNINTNTTTTTATIGTAAMTTDTSPDDSVASQQGSNNTTTNSSTTEADVEVLGAGAGVGIGIGAEASASSSHRLDLTSEDHDDYLLYEFSETRKVLEEFFKPTMGGGGGGGTGGDGRLGNFDELDYTLRRQAGNSYVGQRLAGESCNELTEESPKKPSRRGVLLNVSSGGGASPRLISFQEVSLPSLSHNSHSQTSISPSSMMAMGPASAAMLLDSTSRDVNDNDVDIETASTNTETDLGDTEVGLQVGHSRNFTLSPETTDCDSNELESEISLDYEASLHSSSRLGATMPVLEDGLSSGNVSDNEDRDEDEHSGTFLERKRTGLSSNRKLNSTGKGISSGGIPGVASGGGGGANTEPNPTLLLMKKQISEIEKEIKLRSQRVHHSDTNGSSALTMGIAGTTTATSTSSTNIPGNNGITNGTGSGSTSANDKHSMDINPNDDFSHHRDRDRDRDSRPESNIFDCNDPELEALDPMRPTPPPSPAPSSVPLHHHSLHHLSSQQQLIGHRMVNFPSTRSSDSSGVVTMSSNSNSSLNANSNAPPSSSSNNSSSNNSNSHCGNQLSSLTTAPATTTNITSNSNSNPNTNTNANNNSGSLGLLHDSTNNIILSTDSSTLSSVGTDGSATKDGSIQLPKTLSSHRSSFDSPSTSSGVVTSGGTSTSSGVTTTTLNIVGSSSSSSSSQQVPQPPEPSSPEERLVPLVRDSSPVWVPRHPVSASGNHHPHRSTSVRDPLLRKQRYEDTPDDDADTDQETDRLLGQNRTEDDYGFYDDKEWKKVKSRSILPSMSKGIVSSFKPSSSASIPIQPSQLLLNNNSSSSPNASTSNSANHSLPQKSSSLVSPSQSQSPGPIKDSSSSSSSVLPILQNSTLSSNATTSSSSSASKVKKEKDGVKKKRSKEDLMNNPSVLIEGVLFRARYLGSTQLICEGQPTKATRMMQAEEAVSRIKAQTNQNDSSSCQLSLSPSIETNTALSVITPPYAIKNTNTNTKTKTTEEQEQEEAEEQEQREENEKQNENDDDVDIDVGVVVEGREIPRRINDKRKEWEQGCGHDHVHEHEHEHEEEDGVDGDDEDYMERNEYYRQQRNPVAAALVDNNTIGAALGDTGLNLAIVTNNCESSGRRLSSLEMSMTNIPGGGGLPFNNTGLPIPPHLSPPCGSALPGTMFRLKIVGSLEVDEEVGSGRRRRKRPKKNMVEEAVSKLKAPEGETQPSTEVDLFISTEKIMVLNTDLKEIMMDHALRTISYIADIGDLVVLMARRRPVPTDTVDESKIPRPPKMICHVFESDEAQYIAQSIGQAFQVAYMEFLKANGIEDHSFVREMDYQEVLNSQEIFGDELQMFAKKELQKEVVVPKTKGEILGVVIVESGWGSMLPTVVIANLAPAGAAARCGQLNIGDQIIAINGVSLVGLPLSTCQNYIKNAKTQTVVKLTVVPCPPVVEVKIKRPDTKYQLGFSVQNGVICSLLRGGIAERGGVRVGHRIIEINNQSVVAVPHEKIVNLLATSVGEINMKTMPTSMFRLLTGQETPLFI